MVCEAAHQTVCGVQCATANTQAAALAGAGFDSLSDDATRRDLLSLLRRGGPACGLKRNEIKRLAYLGALDPGHRLGGRRPSCRGGASAWWRRIWPRRAGSAIGAPRTAGGAAGGIPSPVGGARVGELAAAREHERRGPLERELQALRVVIRVLLTALARTDE